MPRAANRIDRNQPELVEALRRARWTVLLLSGYGLPVDLLCADGLIALPKAMHQEILFEWVTAGRFKPSARGGHGKTWVAEIKDPQKNPSARRLTAPCAAFMLTWPGPGAVVLSVEEALEAGAMCRAGELESAATAAQRYVQATGGVG